MIQERAEMAQDKICKEPGVFLGPEYSSVVSVFLGGDQLMVSQAEAQ